MLTTTSAFSLLPTQSSVVPRRYRHVAQVSKPPLQSRPQHRRGGSLCRPKHWYHPYRADIGMQTEGTGVDSEGELCPGGAFGTPLMVAMPYSFSAVLRMRSSGKSRSSTPQRRPQQSPPSIFRCPNSLHATRASVTHPHPTAGQRSRRPRRSKHGWPSGVALRTSLRTGLCSASSKMPTLGRLASQTCSGSYGRIGSSRRRNSRERQPRTGLSPSVSSLVSFGQRPSPWFRGYRWVRGRYCRSKSVARRSFMTDITIHSLYYPPCIPL